MTNRYASKTTVTAERTKAEIEQVLRRYGADQFLHGWEPGRGVIAFRLRKHPVRTTLPLPELEEFRAYQRGNSSVKRTEEAARRAHEQAERQAWRALLLVVKAKLEAVEAGITTIEQEFLAGMVLPDNTTVGEVLLPQLDEALAQGRLPEVLPRGTAIPLPAAQDREREE